MPRTSKRAPYISEPIPARVVQLFDDFAVDQEMGGGFMESKPWQREVARRSKSFQTLFYVANESPNYHEEMNLSLI